MPVLDICKLMFTPSCMHVLIHIPYHSALFICREREGESKKINLEHKYSIPHEIGICSMCLFMAATTYGEFRVNQTHIDTMFDPSL